MPGNAGPTTIATRQPHDPYTGDGAWGTDLLTGKPSTAGAKAGAQLLGSLTASQKQKVLHDSGFNVTLDGLNGPQTSTAWQAHMRGISANAWNEAWTRNHHTLPPVAGAPHDTPPNGHPVIPPVVPPSHAPPRRPASAAAPPGAGSDLVDPQAYAHGAANEQYDPQIAELARQMADANRQQGATQGSLKDWYSKLVGDANAQADANQGDAKAILGDHDTAASGIINALGGSSSAAAADAGAQAGIGRTALEGLGLSNSALSRNLGTAYAGEGVTALGDQDRSYRADLKDALAKKSDLIGAKGAAYVQALQTARSERTAQIKNQTDTAAVAKLSGVQLASAKQGLSDQKLNHQINNWRFQQGIKAANDGGGAGSVPEFTKQNPGQLNQLQTNLLNGTLGKHGNFNQDPSEVFQKMSSTLANLSYGKWDPSTNPAAHAYVTNIIASRLDAWNRQNPQNKYTVKNGQIVHTK